MSRLSETKLCESCGASDGHLYPHWPAVLCHSCVEARLSAAHAEAVPASTSRGVDPIPIITADGIVYRFPQFGRAKRAELLGYRPGIRCIAELLEVSDLSAIRDRLGSEPDFLHEFELLTVVEPGDLRPSVAVSSSRTVWLGSTDLESPAEWARKWCDEYDQPSTPLEDLPPPSMFRHSSPSTGFEGVTS